MLKRIMTLIIAAVGFLWLSLLSGCNSGCGDIEDEVFIQKALEHFIATQSDSTWSSDSVEIPIQIYASVDEFRTENPDCCSFGFSGDDGALPGWWARFNNDYAGTVIVQYNVHLVEENGVRKESQKKWISLNSCAEPISPSKVWP